MTNFLKLFVLLAVLVVTTGPVHAASVDAVEANRLIVASATAADEEAGEAASEDATEDGAATHEESSESSEDAE